MKYKQAKRILTEIAKTGKPDARLAAIQLLSKALPALGRYPPNSPELLLHRMASDSGISSDKRLTALSQLIIKLAEKR